MKWILEIMQVKCTVFFLFIYYACAKLLAGSPNIWEVWVHSEIRGCKFHPCNIWHCSLSMLLMARCSDFSQNFQINYIVYSPKLHMSFFILESLSQILLGMGRRIGICQEPQGREEPKIHSQIL